MEHTGIYANHLLAVLKKLKANIVVEDANTSKIRWVYFVGNMTKSMRSGLHPTFTKTEMNSALWVPKRTIVQQLAQLSALRNRLMDTQMRLTIPLGEQEHFINKKINQATSDLCIGSINAVKSDVLKVDAAILKMIHSDETLNSSLNLIMSIPGIGIITAVQIVVSTNEFKDINCPKKFACYAGVAPFKGDSGTTKVRAKVSHIANKRVKSLIHVCAVRAIRIDQELKLIMKKKNSSGRETENGGLQCHSVQAYITCFVCVNQNRPYAKDYERPQQQVLQEV